MKIIFPFLFMAFLAGCAEMPFLLPEKKADTEAWDLRHAALKNIESWTLQGRMVVIVDDDGWSATLHWVQDQGNYTMRFIAPLGQGTYQLHGDGRLVSFLTAENELYQADNPERLMQENMGWSVPVHGLKYWIKGIPEPGVTSENMLIDEEGRMTDLQQSGWHITISRYADFNGTQMPSKMVMKNDRLQLRLVIQDWKTNT